MLNTEKFITNKLQSFYFPQLCVSCTPIVFCPLFYLINGYKHKSVNISHFTIQWNKLYNLLIRGRIDPMHDYVSSVKIQNIWNYLKKSVSQTYPIQHHNISLSERAFEHNNEILLAALPSSLVRFGLCQNCDVSRTKRDVWLPPSNPS